MLICENEKCGTEMTTASAAHKQIGAGGIVYRCPGCRGYLTDSGAPDKAALAAEKAAREQERQKAAIAASEAKAATDRAAAAKAAEAEKEAAAKAEAASKKHASDTRASKAAARRAQRKADRADDE